MGFLADILMWVAVAAFGLSGAIRILEGKKLLGLALLLLAAANAMFLRIANR
jgi:hypothetical protein